MTQNLTQVNDLPVLSREDFNPYEDYVIVQKLNGETFKAKTSYFATNAGIFFFPKPVNLGSYTGSSILQVTDMNEYALDIHTVILSVQQRKISSGCASDFFYYTSHVTQSTLTEELLKEHRIYLQDSGHPHTIHRQFWAPVVNGNLYWRLTESPAAVNSSNVDIFIHGYIK